jgi:hypothetical protein
LEFVVSKNTMLDSKLALHQKKPPFSILVETGLLHEEPKELGIKGLPDMELCITSN